MTPEIENISDIQEYSSKKLITIGNGLGFKISHIYTVLIKTKNCSGISYKNTLCVPNLKMNLLSIQSMLKDKFYFKRQ